MQLFVPPAHHRDTAKHLQKEQGGTETSRNPAAHHLHVYTSVIGWEVVRWFTRMLVLGTGHINSRLQIHLQHLRQPLTKLPKNHRPEIPTNNTWVKFLQKHRSSLELWRTLFARHDVLFSLSDHLTAEETDFSTWPSASLQNISMIQTDTCWNLYKSFDLLLKFSCRSSARRLSTKLSFCRKWVIWQWGKGSQSRWILPGQRPEKGGIHRHDT